MPFGFTHKPLVALANSAICSFFKDIEVFGSENIPAEGPIIFACTHVNMAVDPALLSNTLPHGHLLHYWVKDSLFKNPAVGAILNNAGNIAVDRKNKNNQKLFKGTFEALARNECIGVFPEGTSHTEPHIIALKDGTSWAALEYLRYLQGTEENKGAKDGKPAIIIPVGIAYVNKSKYRSRVAVNYGAPIDMSAYKDDFLSEEEGKAKLAVKRLTRKIELEVKQMTVNSPDWDTAFAAQMAREILWEKDESLKLSNYVEVGQTLSDLFTTNNPRIRSLRELLVSYHRLLQSSRLSNAALIDVPLPKTLDPSRKVTLPSRITTLWVLFKDTISCLLRLPFFFIPLVFNLPIYGMGLLGGKLVEDELETQAQMKIALALLLSLLMYPIVFFSLWAVFRQSPIAAAVTAGSLWVIRKYHLTLVDENYEAIKRLIAAWRILIGVWLPRRLEMPLPAFLASSTQFAPDPPKIAGLQPSQEKEKWVKPKKVPSRFLVRNVLRVRIEAAKELAAVLLEVEDKDEQVNSSFWLAQRYEGEVLKASKEDEELVDWERPLPKGVRSGRELIQFLREKGARLGRNANVQDHWAAASSGDEAFKTDDEGVRG